MTLVSSLSSSAADVNDKYNNKRLPNNNVGNCVSGKSSTDLSRLAKTQARLQWDFLLTSRPFHSASVCIVRFDG